MSEEQYKDGPWKILGQLVTSSNLALVLGAGLVALGAAGGVKIHGWLPIDDNLWRVAIGVVGLILVVLHFAYREASTGINRRTIESLGIEITYPQDNQTVFGKFDVQGTVAKPLPKGYELVVLRGYPHGGFVPSAQALCDHDKKKWHVQQFDIGSPKKNESRTIEAWIVGPDGTLLIDTWLAAHEVHKGTVSQVQKLAKEEPEPVSWLKPIKKGTSDMYRCAFVRVKGG
jgi:hypothetical protein